MRLKRIAVFLIVMFVANTLGCTATDRVTVSENKLKRIIENLEEDVTEAYNLNIVPDYLLVDMDENISQKDAVLLIKNVDDAIYEKDHSRYLIDAYESADSKKDASRYWMAQCINYSYCEEIYYDLGHTDYPGMTEMMDYCDEENLFWKQPPNAGYILKKNNGRVGEWGGWQDIADGYLLLQNNDGEFRQDYGTRDMIDAAMLLYDRETGQKVMYLDEEQRFNPGNPMTTADAIKIALRYYRSFPEPPVEAAYDDVPTYNKEIITDEMLNKTSSLPDCSSAYLPKEWRGLLVALMKYPTNGALDAQPDDIILEEEIKVIKEAGFNYVDLAISFNRLQDPFYNQGMVNLAQMTYLDQVLAWTIENDIHVTIRCESVPGVDPNTPLADTWAINSQIQYDAELRKEYADFWGMIAKRYQDIPNKYLAFNLFGELAAESDEEMATAFSSAVEAIREYSPDRCLIADVHASGVTGSGVASLGVALSYHTYDPREICAMDEYWDKIDDGLFEGITWPYMDRAGKTWDADAVINAPMFDYPGNPSVLEMQQTADEYGVGFMVGEFGIGGHARDGEIPQQTFTDEMYAAYYNDVLSAFFEHDIPWSHGWWGYGEQGLITGYPSIDRYDYEPLEETNLYKCNTMIEFCREMIETYSAQ